MASQITLTSKLLADQVAIVTGAAQGIGLVTARTLAANGAKVVLADVDAALVTEAAAGLEGLGTAFAGDLVDPSIPDRLVACAADTYGRIDIVVNAAGFYWDALIHKMSDQQFQAMLDIHVIAPFRICRAVAPHFRELAKKEAELGIEHFRKVINVSAIAGSFGLAGGSNYAAGKAALEGFTKSLAIEWGRYKVNANAVAYGAVSTRFGVPQSANYTVKSGGHEVRLGIADKTREHLGLDTKFDPAAIYEPRPMDGSLFGRTGSTQEAADIILWLASPLANFVTGQVITASGGVRGGMS